MADEFVCIHVIEDGKPKEVELDVDDHRFNQPIAVFNKSENQTGIFQRLILTKIAGTDIAFSAPNEIALALGASRSAFNRVKNKKKELLALAKDKGTIHGNDATPFYDALEDLQISIIFSFKAVESLCNTLIPDDYVYETKDSKGIIQRYPKEQIERWISTSDKVKRVIPKIIECPNPCDQPFWNDFKALERLRNELIHSKSKSSSEILAELFSDRIAKYLTSAINLIEFFHSHSVIPQRFPVAFGGMRLKVVEIEKFEDLFEKVE